MVKVLKGTSLFFVKLFMLFMLSAPNCYYAIKHLLSGFGTNFVTVNSKQLIIKNWAKKLECTRLKKKKTLE